MTTEAGDLVMGGGLPRLDIFLHVMTEAAKGRPFGIAENPDKQNEQKKKKKAINNLLLPLDEKGDCPVK